MTTQRTQRNAPGRFAGPPLLALCHLQTHNFPGLALGNHLEWPAAHFAIGGEPLRRDAGVDDQFKALAAERALDGMRYFHRSGNFVQTRTEATPFSHQKNRASLPTSLSAIFSRVTPSADYLNRCRELIVLVEKQQAAIQQAAEWFAATILAGRMVHLFGSGHSRILVEEMWPRYGSFPGFNPIVELSLSFHNLVVGPNGQRQAMFLENVAGLAERILRNFDLSSQDSALVASSSGCNVVPLEMAEHFRRRGIKVVAIVSRKHCDASRSQHPKGCKLPDLADLVLDTGAPVGDAMVKVEGLEAAVSPGSTVGGCLLVNSIKAEVALRLTRAGRPPKVLTAGAVVGAARAAELFEAAYDEHARRLAKLYERLGE
jgi:uncharacterized phosphosugar-binding protein